MTDITHVGAPIMSGHCAFPATHNDKHQPISATLSHERCVLNGAGVVSPDGAWHPCPCACHLGEEFECECGRVIREALNMPLDEDGDEPYAHIDPKDGRAVYTGCPS